MLDFIDVSERMPEDGAEVEVLREVGYHGPAGYCRFKIERTTVWGSKFVCDLTSAGSVLFWRPADHPGPVATKDDYPGLQDLDAE